MTDASAAPQPPSEPRHQVPLIVRFSDLDPLGHLNNVAAIRMFETGRVEFSNDAGLHGEQEGPPFVLAALHVDYRTQAFYRDALVIGTTAGRIGRTSLTLTQRLWRPADGATVAESESVLVVLGEDRRTPAPVPEDWRTRLADW